MKHKSVDGSFLLPVIPLAICIVNYLMEHYSNITYLNCVILAVMFGLFAYGLIIILTINIGNLSKSLYLKAKGFSSLPLFLFPFYIYKSESGKTRIKTALEWSVLFRDLFSQDFIEAYNSNPIKIENIYASEIVVRLISKIVFLLLLAIGCFAIYPDVFVFLTFGTFIFFFSWIAKLDTYSFQGELKRYYDIKCGSIIKYLAQEVCICDMPWSDKKKIYAAFIKWMYESSEDDKDINIKACVSKHIFIEEWHEEQFSLTQNIKGYVEKNILSQNRIGIGIMDETWELLKVYLAYAVFTHDTDAIVHTVKEIRSLKARFGLYSRKFGDMMDWYIKAAYCTISNEEKHKHPLFSKKDPFCDIGPAYKKKVERMEMKLLTEMVT